MKIKNASFAKCGESCRITLQLIKYSSQFAKCEAKICSVGLETLVRGDSRVNFSFGEWQNFSESSSKRKEEANVFIVDEHIMTYFRGLGSQGKPGKVRQNWKKKSNLIEGIFVCVPQCFYSPLEY